MDEIKRLVDSIYMRYVGQYSHNYIINNSKEVRMALIEYNAKTSKDISDSIRELEDYFSPIIPDRDTTSDVDMAKNFINYWMVNHQLDCLGYKGLNRYKRLPYKVQTLIDDIMTSLPQ